jgi:Universal stress protein family
MYWERRHRVFVPHTHSRESWALHRLVLPHDGTATSGPAIAPAADIASRAGAELVVLHVSTPASKHPTEPGTFVTPRYLDQPQHGWPLWEWDFIDRVRSFGLARSSPTPRSRWYFSQPQ